MKVSVGVISWQSAVALKNNVCSCLVFLSQPGEHVKSEKWKWSWLPLRRMDEGGHHAEVWKLSFRVKVNFLTMCLLWEIPLVCRLMFFFFSLPLFPFCWAWFSYLWKDWESSFNFCHIYYQDEDIRTVHEPECNNDGMRAVCGVQKRGRDLQKKEAAASPPPPPAPPQQNPQLLGAWHKIRSPCTDTQGLSQCDWGIAKLTSWDIAWLSVLLGFFCLVFSSQ